MSAVVPSRSTGSGSTTPVIEPDPVIEEIKKTIGERKIIDEALISSESIDTELADMLTEYNEQTRTYYDFFYNMATRTIDYAITDKWDWNPEAPPSYPVSPEVFDEMVLRIADNSLYSDCTQRFLDDPLLAPIIEKEGGGSAGRWPYVWHTDYLDHLPEMKTALAEYFDLVENILRLLES